MECAADKPHKRPANSCNTPSYVVCVQVVEVVEHIEAGKILPPLVVLQTLAKNKDLKVRE